MKNGKKIGKNNKRLAKFNLFLDDRGILRAKGRAKAVASCEFNNQPIILDSKHYATRAIIREYHPRFDYGSNNTVIN